MAPSRFARPLLAVFFALASACATKGPSNGSGGTARGVAGMSGGTAGEGGTVGTDEPGSSKGDVIGRIVDGEGRPLPGAWVALDSDYDNALSTDATGAFSFEDVSPPYDLTVAAGGQVYELRGLTRLDPVIPAAPYWVAERKARVSGTIDCSADFPLDQNEVIAVAFHHSPRSLQDIENGAFSGPMSWLGNDDIAAKLVAAHLRELPTGGLELVAIGSLPNLSLSSGSERDDLSIALHPVDASLNQETEVQIDYGAYTKYVGQRVLYFYHQGTRVPLQPFGGFANGQRIRTPPGATISVHASDATDNSVARVVPAVAGGLTSVVLPPQPALKALAPANRATGVSATPPLTWTPVAGATAYWVSVGAMQFVLPADEARFEVPDYGSLFPGLAPGQESWWQVTAFLEEGFAADDVADGSGLGFAKTLFLDELTVYQSAQTHFVTGP